MLGTEVAKSEIVLACSCFSSTRDEVLTDSENKVCLLRLPEQRSYYTVCVM